MNKYLNLPEEELNRLSAEMCFPNSRLVQDSVDYEWYLEGEFELDEPWKPCQDANQIQNYLIPALRKRKCKIDLMFLDEKNLFDVTISQRTQAKGFDFYNEVCHLISHDDDQINKTTVAAILEADEIIKGEKNE